MEVHLVVPSLGRSRFERDIRLSSFGMSSTFVCFSFAAIFALGQADPVVNLPLSPPSGPLPQVSKLIGELELARQGAETTAEQALQTAFDKAVADGRGRIHQVVADIALRAEGDSVAFFAGRAVGAHGKFSMKVSPPKAPSGAVRWSVGGPPHGTRVLVPVRFSSLVVPVVSRCRFPRKYVCWATDGL